MITVCGEALVDLVAEDGRRFVAHPGGSPANVALGLARLGTDASLLARVSGDAFGRLLREHLTGNGVDARDLVAAPEPTTLAVVGLDGAGAATYDFYVNGTADWQWQPGELPDPLADDVVALHSGSLALALPPGADAVERLLEREHRRGAVTVSLDPNLRPRLEGDADTARVRVERQVRLADVVKVSSEDLAWLHPGAAPADVIAEWHRLGPLVVVATLGGDGVVAVGPDGTVVRRPPVPVTVVDTVGAGDAFSAGLLDGMARAGLLGRANRPALEALSAAALERLLDDAALVAALTCERAGADPPTRAEVTARRTAPATGA